jgi:hypothetical protein
LRGTPEVARAGVEQAWSAGGEEDVAGLIEPATSGAAKHLDQFIGLHLPFEISGEIARVGHDHRAHGEVDSRREPHRRHDHAELPVFRERFHDSRAQGVAEAAVMVRHARPQQLCKSRAGERFLFRGKHERLFGRELSGEVEGEFLRRIAARRKHEDRAKVRPQRVGHEPRPEPANAEGRTARKRFEIHFGERHGADVVRDEHGVPADASQPGDDILRIAHAAAEQEELGRGRSEREGELIVHTPQCITDHLVFIHHEQARPFAAQETAALRLERGDHHLRVQIVCEVAGGNANLPPPRAPLGEFVVGQRPRRHREDGLPL